MPSTLPLSHLKFRHLALLTHLVEFGNLHKAAQYFSVSQPAISAMLKEIEAQLGLNLFTRTNQGVIPTAAARTLSRRAHTILNEFDAFVRDARQLGKDLSPLLRVGVVPHALSTHLPKAIERYRQSGHESVTIREGTAKHLLQQLFEGKLDCVIGRLSASTLSPTDQTNDLSFELLYTDRLCIVEGTAQKRRRRLDYDTLCQRQWVLTQPDSSLRQQLTDLFFRRGLQLPDPVIETTNYIQSLAMLANSDLCSVVPESAVDSHVKLGHIRVLDIPTGLSPMPVSFIVRHAAVQNPQIVKFREIFKSITIEP